MNKLTSEEYQICREKLAEFREQNNYYSTKYRLSCYPIPFGYTEILFGFTEKHWNQYFVCEILGRQLVLKIIDELLDDGEEQW